MCCFGMRWCPCGMGVALGFMLLNNSYVSFRSLSFYGKSCVLLAYPSACCHCPAVDSQPLSRGKGANFRPDTPPLTPVGPPWGLWGRQRRHTKVSGWPKSTRCGRGKCWPSSVLCFSWPLTTLISCDARLSFLPLCCPSCFFSCTRVVVKPKEARRARGATSSPPEQDPNDVSSRDLLEREKR